MAVILRGKSEMPKTLGLIFRFRHRTKRHAIDSALYALVKACDQPRVVLGRGAVGYGQAERRQIIVKAFHLFERRDFVNAVHER